MTTRISQREARRLRKRVAALEAVLEQQKRGWLSDWPGGVNIDTITVKSEEWFIVKTARLLGHACVVLPGDHSQLRVYALPLRGTP